MPQRRKLQRAPWTAQEATAALGAMRGRQLEAYLILGLSGLRTEESLGISPAGIVPQATYDLVTGTEVRTLTLVVRRKYTDADGLVDEAKNEASVRERPAIVAGRDRLLAIVAATRPDPGDPAAVDAWRRSRLVPLRGDTLYKRWKAELEALGLRFIPPDMLRHTSETLMQAAGLPDTAPPASTATRSSRPTTATTCAPARRPWRTRRGKCIDCCLGRTPVGRSGAAHFMQKAGHTARPAVSLVLHGGFEPSTLGLEVPCSIQLS